jgi:GTP-binding protein EngB required for normal cell division
MKAADPAAEMGARSGALERHLKVKLELAALIRSIMQQFHDAKDDRREGLARKLLSRLAEDRFNLAVVGQFKRGKSSLMNAVMGMDRLPTGVLPLTSVVTTVRYGDHEYAVIRIPLGRLQEYVTERGNPGNRKQVVLADVRLPAEVLRLGFHFIDTPGVGSAIAANTATTHEFLPEADAVIFVTSFESAMNEGELAFLRAVARHVHKILFVVNKRDLVSAEESQAVLASIRDTISAQIGGAEPRVFALSAREGLEAKLAGNRDLLSRSGLLEFESALTQFLTADKARVALLRSVERMAALLTPERVESRVSTIRANLSSEAAGRMKAEWERRVEQIDAECLRTAESLRCQIRSELPPPGFRMR